MKPIKMIYTPENCKKQMWIMIDDLLKSATAFTTESDLNELRAMELKLIGARAIVRNAMLDIRRPGLRRSAHTDTHPRGVITPVKDWTLIAGQRAELWVDEEFKTYHEADQFRRWHSLEGACIRCEASGKYRIYHYRGIQ